MESRPSLLMSNGLILVRTLWTGTSERDLFGRIDSLKAVTSEEA